MPEKPKTPEQIAKTKRSRDLNLVRNLLVAGKEVDALAFCQRWGYDIFEARLAPIYQSPAEPWFARRQEEMKLTPEEANPPAPASEAKLDERTVSGWPRESRATVWGFPRNPRLFIAQLPDDRKVSVYRGRFRKPQIHDKITIRLEQAFRDGERQGDPVYEDCSVRGNIW